MHRRFSFLLCVCLLVAGAGYAQFGISKTRVQLQVRHPSEIYVPGRQIRLEVRSDVSAGVSSSSQLRAFLEQELTRAGFEVGAAVPETLIRVVVNQYDMRTYRQAQQDTQYIHTGYHTEYDKKGRAQQKEDCAIRTVNVTRHVARGLLSTSLSVQDIRTGARLADEVLPVDVGAELTVAGPQRCGGNAYDQVPSDFNDVVSLGNYSVQKARSLIQHKLLGWTEPLEVLLAKPDELKPGNEFAVANQWNQALQSWRAASITKSKTEAYRQYNLGVAYEAIAYSSSDEAQALESLKSAEEAYAKAQQLKSDEKYFRPAFVRVNSGRAVLQQVQERKIQRRAEAAKRQAVLEEQTTPEAAPAPVPVGTAEAQQFAEYLHLRFSHRSGDLQPAEREAFVEDGLRFGLSRADALRLVSAQEQQLQAVRKNMDRYRDFYHECWYDKLITREEREQLDTFRKVVGLSPEQVAEVEKEFAAPASGSSVRRKAAPKRKQP